MHKFISASIVGVMLFAGVASAQTADLPSPGVRPGSPFFFLDRFFEGLGGVFTFGQAAKAQRAVAIAEERLSEARALAAEGDENAQRAVALYEEKIAEAAERAENAQNTDALARVTEATTKHFAVLEGVIERVPEQAKASVQRALDSSKQGQVSALQALSGVNPDRAVEVGANAAKEIAAQAKADATARKAEAMDQKLQHFEGVLASFANAPRGRADVEAKFSERMTEIVGELDEVKSAADMFIKIGDVKGELADRVSGAKDRVISSQLSSLRELVREDPAKAVEIFAQAAEGRLNAARRDAEERNGEATEESLEDYNKYAEFGQQISTMAEGIRTGETTVEDLVKQATSHHRQVLEEVRQKLPPQAQQEFQRALDNSQRVQDQRPATPAPTQPGIQQQRQPTQPVVPQQQPSTPQTQPEREVETEQPGIPTTPTTPQAPGGRP